MKTINIILAIGIVIGIVIGIICIVLRVVFKEVEQDLELLSGEPIKPPSKPIERQKTFEDLLDAIEWVESKGDANAVGDCGAAVGSFQIHKIYVRDVNRIDHASFHYEDRKSRQVSRMMADIYTKWYASRAFDETGDETKFFEYATRCHNGGPNGWKKDCTKAYWAKVKARLEE